MEGNGNVISLVNDPGIALAVISVMLAVMTWLTNEVRSHWHRPQEVWHEGSLLDLRVGIHRDVSAWLYSVIVLVGFAALLVSSQLARASVHDALFYPTVALMITTAVLLVLAPVLSIPVTRNLMGTIILRQGFIVIGMTLFALFSLDIVETVDSWCKDVAAIVNIIAVLLSSIFVIFLSLRLYGWITQRILVE